MLARYRARLIVVTFALIGLLGAAGASGAEPPLPPPDEAQGPEVSALAPATSREGDTPETPPPAFDRAGTDSNPPAEAIAESPFPPFPIERNEAVERFMEHYQSESRREVVGRWLDRSTRYLSMIRQVFRKKGLPEDLAFTAMVESGFNPRAVSRAGAKGLWQFMAQTARRYGLRVDRWVDERLDPEKSTEAAAEHLKDLFAQFGHWYLAQAAYNAGEVKVARAVARARTNDFWTIARGRWLRWETKQFVPQIQAAVLIAREPERYGFQITPEEPIVYEVVSVPFSVDLKRLAALAELPPDSLRDLNPELRRGMTPPGERYALRVPPGSVPTVQAALEQIGSQRTTPTKHRAVKGVKTSGVYFPARIHVVKPRDTLSEIAERYGVSVSELVRLNGLDPEGRIYPGDRIRVTVSVLPSGREPAD